ncbi:MAG: signal recognition particle-docking protein FtsY, partial [Alphaproteobacteria bacterium]|nr:signal recognition particle-docking protein FtsY [Alphaproteobacteria bacterium]
MFRARRGARRTWQLRAHPHHRRVRDTGIGRMRDFGEAPPPPTFFERLREGLSRSTGGLTESIVKAVSNKKLDAVSIGELEEALIKADLGPVLASRLAQAVSARGFGSDVSDYDIRETLRSELLNVLSPIEKPLHVTDDHKPFVILVVGVNGTGKTTTIGKLAKRFASNGAKVILAAGDTFRAAAIEQLAVWGQRTGAEVVAKQAGADAAGLAFEALEKAKATGADVLMIDTAGRLQNKAGLMAELEKIVRVIRKLDATAPHATLLVLDATTGQN